MKFLAIAVFALFFAVSCGSAETKSEQAPEAAPAEETAPAAEEAAPAAEETAPAAEETAPAAEEAAPAEEAPAEEAAE